MALSYPVLSGAEAEIVGLRDSPRAWHLLTTGATRDTVLMRVWIPDELGAWARDYLLGLIAARVGDSVSAVRHAAALERATQPVDTVGLRNDSALEIRSLIAFRAGRMNESLALLQRARLTAPNEGLALNPFNRRRSIAFFERKR